MGRNRQKPAQAVRFQSPVRAEYDYIIMYQVGNASIACAAQEEFE